MESLFWSQYSVMRMPRTSSITKYGRPVSVAPASSTLAMFGWSIIASACRSASKRATTCLRVHAQLDDLERDAAAHRFLLLGHVDHAAAAFADFLQQLVTANAVAGFFRDWNSHKGGSAKVDTRGRCYQKIVSLFVGSQQCLNLLTQRSIAGTGFIQIRSAQCVGQIQRLVQNGHFKMYRLNHRLCFYSVMRKTEAERARNLAKRPVTKMADSVLHLIGSHSNAGLNPN